MIHPSSIRLKQCEAVTTKVSRVLNISRTAVICAILLTAVSGCSKTGAPSSARSDGVLRIAVPQDPKTLNPILTSSTIDASVQRLMFEPLISADAQGREVPILAAQVPSIENGGISRDGLTIMYHLRPNLHWSDGVPLTSKDVAFSWTAVMNPDNDVVSRHGYDDIARVDIPGDTTVVVHLRAPLASFVNTFFAESDSPYDVLPAHVLERYPNLNQIPFNDRPDVVDGPFKFVRWLHGDRVTLAANDSFFMGKPKLRGIEVQTVAQRGHGRESAANGRGRLLVPDLDHDLPNLARDSRHAPGVVEHERVRRNGVQHAPQADERSAFSSGNRLRNR